MEIRKAGQDGKATREIEMTPDQVAWIKEATVQASLSLVERYRRLPTQTEVTRIVTLLSRYALAPNASSFDLQ